MGSIIVIDPFAVDRDEAGDLPDEYEWQLVGSWDWSQNEFEIMFTDLDGWTELMFRLKDVTLGGTSLRTIQVSDDNGDSYYSSAGNYVEIRNTGQEFNSSIALPDVSSGIARTATAIFRNWGSNGVPKTVWCWDDTGSKNLIAIDATQLPLNALKFTNSGFDDITGGSVRIYAR